MIDVKCIPDAHLITIPVKDNGERMLYLPDYSSHIKIGYAHYVQNEAIEVKKLHHFVRETVAKKLVRATRYLPEGMCFLVLCGYRPLFIQKKRYIQVWERVKNENPHWNNEQIKQETDKWVAPLEIIPPHSTGGAVDITLCDKEGNLLDMGTRIGDAHEKSPLRSKGLNTQEKANREILIHALESEGFINYPLEWWHWSYGDRYWAGATQQALSIYHSIDMSIPEPHEG